MLKSCFNNTESRLLGYRDFNISHKKTLKMNLVKLFDCSDSYDDFDRIFRSKLNKHAHKIKIKKHENKRQN